MALDAFGSWCVKSNLKHIDEEGADPATVLATLRGNGYPSIAAAVEAELDKRT